MEETDLEKIIIKTDRTDDCAICLNRIGRRDIGTLQCGHSFHWSCCKKMFLENNYVSCPLCRKAILKRTSSEERERINMEFERRTRENQENRISPIRCFNRDYNYDKCMAFLCRLLFVINMFMCVYSYGSLLYSYYSNFSTVLLIFLNFSSHGISILLFSIKKTHNHICYKRD